LARFLKVNGGIEKLGREETLYYMTDLTKFVMALVGLLSMSIVASRQLFLFAVLRDTSDLSIAGGRLHFLLALIAGATACLAGGLVFRFFSRHEKNKWSQVEMIPVGPPLALIALNQPNSPALNSMRLARVSLWLPEAQADDRTPMDGSVTDSGQTPSGQRSFARRTHQLMFKKWSQARHD
jgi:hypothetical protein